MKTIEEIIKQEPVFLHQFGSQAGVFEEFRSDRWSTHYFSGHNTEAKDFDGHKVLFASYTYENYEGDAFVLAEKDGKLYEVTGGHCSCYGLEGQWTPEEVVLLELEQRLTKGQLGMNSWPKENVFNKELKIFLGIQ